MAKVGQKNWQLRQILLQPQPSATVRKENPWLPLESCVDGVRHLRLLVCSRLALPREWLNVVTILDEICAGDL